MVTANSVTRATLGPACAVTYQAADQQLESLGLNSNLASLLDWSRHYLPHYFRLAPSNMHRWLGEQLDAARHERGTKLNVIGPRGSAKSTVATLAYALRCAVEGSEQYIWIISDTKHQAAVHLENIRTELEENRPLKQDHRKALAKPPQVRGNIIRLADGTVIEAYGTGQRIRGKRRRQHRPTLILCDDLQNDDHIASTWQRQRSREWFQGTLLKAGTKRTEHRQPGDGPASRRAGHGAASHARLEFADLQSHRALAHELVAVMNWNSNTNRASVHTKKALNCLYSTGRPSGPRTSGTTSPS